MKQSSSGPSSSVRRVLDAACVVLFSCALLLPLFGFLFDWHPVTPPNRPLHRAREGAPAIQPLEGLAERWEHYFDRHLGFRQLMVRWNNAITIIWLRTDPTTRIHEREEALARRGGLEAGHVVVGKQGWLFYFPPSSEESFRGLDPLEPIDLKGWRRYFELRRRALARRDIAYLLVVIPEKFSLRPDLLPAFLQKRAGPSRTDQVLADLEAHTSVEALDLRSWMRELRLGHPLYYRTGTHWNEFGAFLAYQEVLRHLQARFPQLEPWPLEHFQVEWKQGPERGLSSRLGITGMLTDEYAEMTPRSPHVRRPIESSDQKKWWGRSLRRRTGEEAAPRAVFLHDSFVVTHMEPFLSQHFEEAMYFWNTFTPLPDVFAARPDLVVEVRVERFFDRMLPGPRGTLVARDDPDAVRR